MKFRDLVYMRANSMGDNKQILIKVKLDVRNVLRGWPRMTRFEVDNFLLNLAGLLVSLRNTAVCV